MDLDFKADFYLLYHLLFEMEIKSFVYLHNFSLFKIWESSFVINIIQDLNYSYFDIKSVESMIQTFMDYHELWTHFL
jgi:hypothetical protein